MRLVVDAPLSAAQEALLTEVICNALGHAFQLSFVYFSKQMPLGKNGKFEEFVSALG